MRVKRSVDQNLAAFDQYTHRLPGPLRSGMSLVAVRPIEGAYRSRGLIAHGPSATPTPTEPGTPRRA